MTKRIVSPLKKLMLAAVTTLLLAGTYAVATDISSPQVDGGPFCPYRTCCRPFGHCPGGSTKL